MNARLKPLVWCDAGNTAPTGFTCCEGQKADCQVNSFIQSLGRLGGDCFAVWQTHTDQIRFILIDICGKGTAAESHQTLIRHHLENLACLDLSPGEFLEQFNRMIYPDFERGQYFAAFMGSLNLTDFTLQYAAGAWPWPVCIQKHPPQYFTFESNGLPIGLTKHATFDDREITLPRNGHLLFFSDGISEGFSDQNSRKIDRKNSEKLAQTFLEKDQDHTAFFPLVQNITNETRQDDAMMVVFSFKEEGP